MTHTILWIIGVAFAIALLAGVWLTVDTIRAGHRSKRTNQQINRDGR